MAIRTAKDPRFERLHCDRKSPPPVSQSRQDVGRIFMSSALIGIDKGTYADNCLVERVTVHKCYIVATVSSPSHILYHPRGKGSAILMVQCDRDLRKRLRKVPGIPLMYVRKHKYAIERLPEYVYLACVISESFRGVEAHTIQWGCGVLVHMYRTGLIHYNLPLVRSISSGKQRIEFCCTFACI